MLTFKQIPSTDNIQKVIKSAFDTELTISGGWGYSKDDHTTIQDDNTTPINQLEHTLASMRAYIEMSMTQDKENRYGSINLNEISRENIHSNKFIFHKVIYTLTAMKDRDYSAFINEYKEGYGNEGFDLNDHFERRKKSTVTREITYWFKISNSI